MIKRLVILLGFLLCSSASALATTSSPMPGISAAEVPTPKASDAVTSSPLNVSVDHGTSLTLSAPAASVFIANPEIADVQLMSPTSIMIFGKRTGNTTFMATDSNGNTLAQRTVVVLQDLTDLRQDMDIAIPGNHIHAKAVPNGVVLTGEAKDSATIADAYKLAQRYLPASGGDIINRVHVVGSNQIMIRVRFAEVERDIDNTLGIDWNSLTSIAGGFTFGIASGAAAAISGTATAAVAGTPPVPPVSSVALTRSPNATLAEPNDSIGFGHSGQRTNISGVIDALAQDGLITILAEPTLTAMSGETANFLAGGEIPYVVPTGSGSSVTYSVTFKPYGVSLSFTPTLISEDRINLHVKPEVSELSTLGAVTISGTSVPSFLTRRAETTVEVASGESFAIGGLLDNDQRQTIDKYPMLGDLPILGNLFRSNHFQSGQTELIVIITPYVVKPTNGALGLPTDGFSAPSDLDRLSLRYSNSDPNARPISGTPTGVSVEPPVAAAPTFPTAGSVHPETIPQFDPFTPVMAEPSSSNLGPLLPIMPTAPISPIPAPASPAANSVHTETTPQHSDSLPAVAPYTPVMAGPGSSNPGSLPPVIPTVPISPVPGPASPAAISVQTEATPEHSDLLPPVAVPPNPLDSRPSLAAPVRLDLTKKLPEGPGGFIVE